MAKLQSMTGFSSATKSTEKWQITCEMRSVNGKNLDLRLRLPSGLEALEAPIKKNISAQISRGNIQISISIEGLDERSGISIDEKAFHALAQKASSLAKINGISAPTTDGILAVRGIVTLDEGASFSSQVDDPLKAMILETVEEATDNLVSMRVIEGDALKNVLSEHLRLIEKYTIAARDDEANSSQAIMARLQDQLAKLLEAHSDNALDPQRLNAEAALLATKADIREEIDRLLAHVTAVGDLLNAGGPIGRKLDFLAQEFNRETNTICSKSSSATLTAIGLDLKAVIDQFREQLQNLQ